MLPIVFDKEPAYILHRRPYQEASHLIQFLTLNYGCITVLARQSAKTLGQSFQPFTPALLTCARGNTMFSLRQLDVQDKLLLTHPQTMMLGLYLNELLLKLVPVRVKSIRLFHLYADTLVQLSKKISGQEAHDNILRRFEILLLEIIGYGLQLEHNAQTGQPLQANALYCYKPGTGPVHYIADAHRELPICRGSTLLALSKHSDHSFSECDTQTLQEARALMRTMVAYHLRGKDVNTRSIFQFLQRCE